MVLLETNVISEPLKARADPKVANWINAQHIETLYPTTFGLAELRFGIAALPSGKRKDVLNASLEQSVLLLFEGRFCHLT
ncbi:PIN domain-containing protein [Methylophilus medardicus]|uniref:hypothetical protein n=1 Tax=Methylophilus medardicus TaxID=2588534 RepID=UPI001CB9AF55|nr:hypothetical protein [Methylophilus medardicus]